MIKQTLKISTYTIVCLLAACQNQAFVKKSGQTNDQYRNDMMYCKGEAVGAWNDRNGVSKMNIHKGEMGVISYEDCMRQLGYEQVK
ncbi:MAG: hypothetical protein R3219_02210 [Hydrogenovibrio sp.]|nr:hypothetical protein [Hydrogenovibrio sp.]